MFSDPYTLQAPPVVEPPGYCNICQAYHPPQMHTVPWAVTVNSPPCAVPCGADNPGTRTKVYADAASVQGTQPSCLRRPEHSTKYVEISNVLSRCIPGALGRLGFCGKDHVERDLDLCYLGSCTFGHSGRTPLLRRDSGGREIGRIFQRAGFSY